MKQLCFSLCVIILTCGLWAGGERTIILPGPTAPSQILIDNGRLYVLDGPSIYIYSLKNFKLKKKFGGKGEGRSLFMDTGPGQLLVNSIGKVSLFSKTGEYKKGIKTLTGRRFLFLGGNFLGVDNALAGKSDFRTLNIYNPELIREKELLRVSSGDKRGLEDEELSFLDDSPLAFQVMDDKIFCSGGTGDFNISVFDMKGEKSFTIEHDYERIRFGRQHSGKVYEWIKKNAINNEQLEWFLKAIRLPAYFPAIRQIVADRHTGTLYAMTYLEKEGKTEFFLFDSGGAFIKRVFLPVCLNVSHRVIPFVDDLCPLTLADGKLYQLVKGKEKKEFVLHITPVPPGTTSKDLTARARFEWVKRGGLSGYDHGNSLTTDKNNNVYITGTFEKVTDFEGSLLPAAGKKARDVVIAKYDSAGNLKWFKGAGGGGFDEGRCISADSKDNLYVTGFFQGEARFDNITLKSNGDRDIFIAKYDGSGKVVWARQAGSSGIDKGFSVCCDPHDNVLVTGSFRETAAFGDRKLTARGFSDIFIAKYDPAGKLIWVKQAGGKGFDRGLAVTADRAGNVYATGYFKDEARFDQTRLTSNGGRDIFISKYSPDGEFRWAVKAGGTYWDYGYALTVDNKDRLYVTGFFYENAVFGEHKLEAVNQNDLFVASYDGSGKLLWVRQAGGSSYDRGKSIVADNKGHIYVAGHFKKDITFPGCSMTAHGEYDSFIAKYDDRGNFLWAGHAGGKYYDEACAIALGKDNAIYMTGEFYIFGVFDKIELAGYPTDIFVGKLVDPAARGTSESTSSHLGAAQPIKSFDRTFSKVRPPAGNHQVGSMMVITTEEFSTAVEPLVTWKNRKGIKTDLYLYPRDTGAKPEDIKAFVNKAASDPLRNLKYILIVGDAEDVPTGKGTFADADGKPSDTYYTVPNFAELNTYAANVDRVTRLMIGRFSVENLTQARTVVNKNLWYEMTPDARGEWYHKAAGFGGIDPFFTPDPRELVDEIGDSMTKHHCKEFKKIYDPDAKLLDIVSAVNHGIGWFIAYQHGWHGGWGGLFTTPNVEFLNNTKKTPVVLTDSCSLGNFAGRTCFAEAWQRLGTPEEPRGSILFLGSSAVIWHQTWTGLQEMIRSLEEDKTFIAGEIIRAGMRKMVPMFPHGPDYEGPVTLQMWHIFGDPSLFVYTDTPTKMAVAHDSTLRGGSKTFRVRVSDAKGPVKKALAALYMKGKLYGSAWSDETGTAVITLPHPITESGEMEVNVTGYNKLPYFGKIDVARRKK